MARQRGWMMDDRWENVWDLDFLQAHSNLTRNQLFIWIGQTLQPQSPVYNMAHLFTLETAIDPALFQETFQRLVDASDALRTVIWNERGIPQQRVLSQVVCKMPFLDFSQQEDPEGALQKWAQQRCRQPFALEKLLFDCALIRLAPRRFAWYFNKHHIISDIWSTALVWEWMVKQYARLQAGQPESIPTELPPFRDYVVAERHMRETKTYRKAETYWARKLAEDVPPVWFYDPTCEKKSTHVRRHTLSLSAEQSAQLHSLARHKDVFALSVHASLLSVLEAILCTLLYRLTDSGRLALGIPFHQRHSRDFRETIGLFMVTQPVHVDVRGDETFLSLIQAIARENFEAMSHAVFATGNSRQRPAYDVLLNYHTVTFPDFQGVPARVQWLSTGQGLESLAVHVYQYDLAGSLQLDFDFHCDVFTEEQQGWFIQHFLQVMETVLVDPGQRLSQVALISPHERKQVLVEFNQTAVDFPADKTLPQLFEEQVEKTPTGVALLYGKQAIPFQALNGWANQIAYHLRGRGVGPEARVGVFMYRSPALVASLLGILKAGAAYVPLDPTYPQERLAFMARDAGISVLLTEERLLGKHPACAATVVCVDTLLAQQREGTKTDQSRQPDPFSYPAPDQAAYVIYTSGSTGVPKGVVGLHRNTVNRLAWMWRTYPFEAGEVCCHKTSLSFVDAVWEIFGPLLQGVPAAILPENGVSDPHRLIDLLAIHGVTRIVLVPALLRMLLQQEEELQRRLSRLKYWVSSGEALSPELVARFRASFPDAILLNLYGSSEVAADVTWYEVGTDEPDAVPIGRPIANTQIYLLDSHLQPIPLGMAGEIYVGGVGLARGYLGRPALTAERFIPDPFGAAGARLYKTGDIGRFTLDGNLLFLGRRDHQVKIRGYRIELGEVEAALKDYPAVREAVVVPVAGAEEKSVGSPAGPTQHFTHLAAYVVGAALDISDLRHFLRQRIPEYMIPTVFIPLEAFPLTPNGKLDRRALPDPTGANVPEKASYVAPRTPAEEVLAQIWSEVLRISPIGVHDHFLDLGGHSLAAVQVISRVNRQFQIDLAPHQLFDVPTIADLAGLVETTIFQEIAALSEEEAQHALGLVTE